jgi:hypothetical protein
MFWNKGKTKKRLAELEVNIKINNDLFTERIATLENQIKVINTDLSISNDGKDTTEANQQLPTLPNEVDNNDTMNEPKEL